MKAKTFMLFLLLLPSIAWCPEIPWDYQCASVIMKSMRDDGEVYWVDGNKKTPVTMEYILSVVDACLDAAHLNPSWGSEQQCTKRWLVAIYTQSRFWRYCFAPCKDGSKSIGICQINAQHWRNHKCLWYRYCKAMGYTNKDPKQLWKVEENIKFACWYNQFAQNWDLDNYHFNRTKDQKKLYQALLKVNDNAVIIRTFQ